MLHVVAERITRIFPMGKGEVVGVLEIDLEISQGEMVLIKGESGSGKSTLLSLLAGLDRPTSGSLTVSGLKLESASAGELTEFRRKSVGIVFQSFNLLPTLTVLENVSLPALLAGEGRPTVTKRAAELLGWLGMEKRVNHFPSQLSGGEMQRSAIARSLINDPSLILADEPTGNLDSKNGTAVIELLAELNRDLRRTVIIATHSSLADTYCTTRLVLKDGAIVER
jgi:putative ABC transport system ATP-binding protein